MRLLRNHHQFAGTGPHRAELEEKKGTAELTRATRARGINACPRLAPLPFLAFAITGGIIVLDDFSQQSKFHNFVEQNDPVM
jgi:hypothetical protein